MYLKEILNELNIKKDDKKFKMRKEIAKYFFDKNINVY